MRRPLPDLPWVSAFPELNVRLYVERDGKPGVWFLSLDAPNSLAVWAARQFFYLPYRRTRIAFERGQDGVPVPLALPGGRFEAAGGAGGIRAAAGVARSFLVEQYCLYAKSPSGKMYRGEVHHAP